MESKSISLSQSFTLSTLSEGTRIPTPGSSTLPSMSTDAWTRCEVTTRYWYRQKHAEVTRSKICMLLSWNHNFAIDTVGPDYFLRLNDSSFYHHSLETTTIFNWRLPPASMGTSASLFESFATGESQLLSPRTSFIIPCVKHKPWTFPSLDPTMAKCRSLEKAQRRSRLSRLGRVSTT